jgi:hypothetical protein
LEGRNLFHEAARCEDAAMPLPQVAPPARRIKKGYPCFGDSFPIAGNVGTERCVIRGTIAEGKLSSCSVKLIRSAAVSMD